LSRDVIKHDEFRALFTASPASDAAASGPGEEAVSKRYSSKRVRTRELLARLEQAEARERRNVAEAAREAREAALAEARAEHQAVLDAFRASTAALDAAMTREIELATSELIALSTAIASRILRREIRRDDDYVIRLVRRCLGKVLQPSVVRIRLHPDDRDRVAAAAASLTADGDPRHQLAFDADRRVERGGCVVEIPEFVVDARADTQLAAAAAALGGAR